MSKSLRPQTVVLNVEEDDISDFHCFGLNQLNVKRFTLLLPVRFPPNRLSYIWHETLVGNKMTIASGVLFELILSRKLLTVSGSCGHLCKCSLFAVILCGYILFQVMM